MVEFDEKSVSHFLPRGGYQHPFCASSNLLLQDHARRQLRDSKLAQFHSCRFWFYARQSVDKFPPEFLVPIAKLGNRIFVGQALHAEAIKSNCQLEYFRAQLDVLHR